MDLALEALDLPAARREQARLRARGPLPRHRRRELRGGDRHRAERERGGARAIPTARVTVVSGAAPQGQGHVTMFSRLVGRAARRGSRRDRGADRRHRARAHRRRHLRQPHRRDRRQRGAAGLARGAARRRGGSPRTCWRRRRPTSWSSDGAFAVRGLPSRALGWREVAAAAHAGRVPGESRGARGHPGLQRVAVELRQRHPRGGAGGGSGDRRGRDPALDRGARLRPRARAGHRRRADPRRRWCRACRTRSTSSSPTTTAASASPRR